MSKSITKPTLSAPVVQSRLEHHHNQQLRINSHKRSNSKSTPKFKRHSHPKELPPSAASIPTLIRGDDIDIDRDSSIEQNRYRLVENTQNNDEARPGKQSNLQRKSSNGRRKYQSDSNDEKPITILKRSQSITDLTKSSHPIRSFSDEDVAERQTKLEKPTTPPLYLSRLQSSKERRRSDIQPAKTKRSQHRKDIKSVNDVFSLLVNTTPQSQDKNTFTTSVNSTTTTTTTTTTNLPSSNQNTRMLVTPLKDTDSFAFPPSTHSRRRMSSTAIEIKQHVQQFSDSKSSSDLKSVRHNRPASTPAKQQLYAGPDFHNAPAPSELPIPSFVSKSLGKEKSLLEDNLFGVSNVSNSAPSSINSSPTPPRTPPTPSFILDGAYDDDLFIMDDVHAVNSTYDDAYIRQQQSIQLKMMLASSKEKQSIAYNAPTTYQQSAPMAYNVPQKMATARPLRVYDDDTQGMSLTEISESLRSLLKISGH